MRLLWSIFVLAVLPLTAPATDATQPNILVILADDMGYGDPGCYNPKSKIATPNIDRLAHEGMRFTDAHAPGPLCHPSRYGLMTRRYPLRTDVSLWPQQPLIEKGQVTGNLSISSAPAGSHNPRRANPKPATPPGSSTTSATTRPRPIIST